MDADSSQAPPPVETYVTRTAAAEFPRFWTWIPASHPPRPLKIIGAYRVGAGVVAAAYTNRPPPDRSSDTTVATGPDAFTMALPANPGARPTSAVEVVADPQPGSANGTRADSAPADESTSTDPETATDDEFWMVQEVVQLS